ncbi:MAG TPA: hypothetical protein VMG81_03885 [Thermoplasmata archaeon]|nr:hypothetical protein [Thermoplasmata archaeon]
MALLGICALAFVLLVPSTTWAAPASPAASPGSTGAAQPAASVPSVTWNGANVNGANSSSSAFTVTFNEAINVLFSWDPSLYPNVNDARLQMIYFGFPVSTRDVAPPAGTPLQPSSSVALNWTVGAIQYVFEGTFGITASLIANGSTLWSESFYVRLVAPFSVFAAAPLVLIILGIYEVYALARSGRQAGLQRRKKSPPPTTATPSAPAGAAPTEPGPPAGAPPAPPPAAPAPAPPPPPASEPPAGEPPTEGGTS